MCFLQRLIDQYAVPTLGNADRTLTGISTRNPDPSNMNIIERAMNEADTTNPLKGNIAYERISYACDACREKNEAIQEICPHCEYLVSPWKIGDAFSALISASSREAAQVEFLGLPPSSSKKFFPLDRLDAFAANIVPFEDHPRSRYVFHMVMDPDAGGPASAFAVAVAVRIPFTEKVLVRFFLFFIDRRRGPPPRAQCPGIS